MHVGPKLLCTTQNNTAATMRWIDYTSPAKLRCWLNERRALKEWDVLDERHRHITTSSVEVVTWLNLSPHPPWKYRADALQPPYHLPTRKATWLCQKDRIHGQEADQGVTVTTSPLLIIGMEKKNPIWKMVHVEKKKKAVQLLPVYRPQSHRYAAASFSYCWNACKRTCTRPAQLNWCCSSLHQKWWRGNNLYSRVLPRLLIIKSVLHLSSIRHVEI